MLEEVAESFRMRVMMRTVMGVGILLLLSLVMSCQELRYMVSGKVTEVGGYLHRDTRTENGRTYQVEVLTYSYTDGKETWNHSLDVPEDYALKADSMIKVQYIPGRDASRLEGQHNWFWISIFFGSLITVVIGIILIGKFG